MLHATWSAGAHSKTDGRTGKESMKGETFQRGNELQLYLEWKHESEGVDFYS